MSAFDELNHENKQIIRMLNIIDHTAEHLKTGRPVPVEIVNDELAFVRDFAERCHHEKEEDIFFPVIEPKLSPNHKEAMHSLLNDHIQGRKFIKKARKNLNKAADGDQIAANIVAENLTDYADLLRSHIEKEEVFFQEIEPTLNKEEAMLINKKCEKMEEKLDEDEHFLDMLDRLEASEVLRKI